MASAQLDSHSDDAYMAKWHDHFVNLFTKHSSDFSVSEKAKYLKVSEESVEEYLKLEAEKLSLQKERSIQEKERSSIFFSYFEKNASWKHHSYPDLRTVYHETLSGS